MSLPVLRTLGVAGVALLGMALAPGWSAAEQGWPITENRGGSTYSPRYYGSYVPAYTSFTPARVATPALASTAIRVQVPAQARVWFDNQPTSQAGSVRDFVSPLLAPGREYHYTIRAAWSQDGHESERTQSVSFVPGDPVSIDFTTSMVSVGR